MNTNSRPFIRNRKLALSSTAQDLPTSDLIQECSYCHGFFMKCCSTIESCDGSKRGASYPCHHYRVVFTSGVCIETITDAEQRNAKCGVGIAYGSDEGAQFSEPAEIEDNPMARRAQIVAVMRGLTKLQDSPGVKLSKEKEEPQQWVVATDSEYVFKSITEILPEWKAHRKGDEPTDLELFENLHGQLAYNENSGARIGFWRISRSHNKIAFCLAGEAADENFKRF